MKLRKLFNPAGAGSGGMRLRMFRSPPACHLSPRMRRDIGLEPAMEAPRFPPCAVLVTRI